MRPAGRTLPSQSLWLPALLLQMLLGDAQQHDVIFQPDSGFASYEITIPKKLSYRVGEQGLVQHLSYLLHIQGKKHVLHLRPKRLLLPRHLRVFSFTHQGELVEDHPYIPRDCNFMGSVEGSKESQATFSTCMGGLRGVLKVDAQDFQIEPLRTSSTFEHIVYLLKEEEPFLSQNCDLVDDEEIKKLMSPKDYMARIRSIKASYKHPKYMELVLVFDHDRFLYSKSNITKVTNDAILISAILDTYYQDVFTRIHLTAVEVWTDRDKARIHHRTISRALGQFSVYRTSNLLVRIPHDWTHLFAIKDYVKGLAGSAGGMCWLASVSLAILKDENILGPATWTAHEIGHGLGMDHDGLECLCKGRRNCIMGSGRTGFSNCSYEEFLYFTNSEAACLDNIPGQGLVIKRCGNKIVEENEQCDCGTKEECEKDQCCQLDCKLKEGANCSTGLCCHNCQFRPSRFVCRRPENECDLPEYCLGNSSDCPEDTYKVDGTPCKYEARCFKKGCRSRYMQCQSIFGSGVREAPYQCYHVVNSVGDQFGNCRMEERVDLVYKKCSRENSLCGRIQCVNVKSLPDSPDHATIMSTHLKEENLMCWTIGYHLNMRPLGIADAGVISDGTSCGKDRVCFNRSCVPVQSVLNYDCLPKKCNNRGVCNNKKNCHCLYGWAPPFCEEEGFGGSIDSGPAGPLEKEVSANIQIVSIMFLRLALFIISLVILAFWNVIDSYIIPKPETQ
ncbi:disintegrin and metalloproteinase domain-containing protein 30 [Erinaceus europaeus]|uniref:Disintegrin and metalloproteinase domain-containing protein 30 n=1 Tax=Erinaceus europaeus TaxID=9365 RepID=A0A1S3A3I1_ERIEU|nr:disintegrin and metalloproteinase domain-containing protein 30 [Erinaceus europaeus]